MQPLAWLVTWRTLGVTRRAPFVERSRAEVWRDKQRGTLQALIACSPIGSPAAWLVRYGDQLQHTMVTLDNEDGMRAAAKLHGQRFPLMLG